MFAMLRRGGTTDEGLGRWIALALAPHALVALVAPHLSLGAGGRAGARGPDVIEARIDVGAEAGHAEPPRPSPPPVATPPVVEAPASVPSPPAPPLVRPPSPVKPPDNAKLPDAISDKLQHFTAAAADAVAQAAKVLTSDDLASGGAAIATGDGQGPGYGLVAGDGTGDTPTWRANAAIGGKVGGKGTSTKPDAPLEPDRSRGAHVMGGFTDECDFPTEADLAGIDHAVAIVIVTVKADGHADHVQVIDDPGHGFGRAASACAMKRMYSVARDKHGTPIAADTPPVLFRFTR
jgi:periplasmic protein TonB